MTFSTRPYLESPDHFLNAFVQGCRKAMQDPASEAAQDALDHLALELASGSGEALGEPVEVGPKSGQFRVFFTWITVHKMNQPCNFPSFFWLGIWWSLDSEIDKPNELRIRWRANGVWGICAIRQESKPLLARQWDWALANGLTATKDWWFQPPRSTKSKTEPLWNEASSVRRETLG